MGYFKSIDFGNVVYYTRPDQAGRLATALRKYGSNLYKLAQGNLIVPSMFRYKFLSIKSFPVATFDILDTKKIYLGLSRLDFMFVKPIIRNIINALVIPASELVAHNNPIKFKSSDLYKLSHKFYSGFLSITLNIDSKKSQILGKEYLDIMLANQRNLLRGITIPKKSKLYQFLSNLDPRGLIEYPPDSSYNQEIRETYMSFFNFDPYDKGNFPEKLNPKLYPISSDLVSVGRPAGRILHETGYIDILNRVI